MLLIQLFHLQLHQLNIKLLLNIRELNSFTILNTLINKVRPQSILHKLDKLKPSIEPRLQQSGVTFPVLHIDDPLHKFRFQVRLKELNQEQEASLGSLSGANMHTIVVTVVDGGRCHHKWIVVLVHGLVLIAQVSKDFDVVNEASKVHGTTVDIVSVTESCQGSVSLTHQVTKDFNLTLG